LEIREFLASRRAKISPERAGLPRYGSKRRVPGLRREEVALLADVSVEYYTRLERGGARGVSRGRRRRQRSVGPDATRPADDPDTSPAAWPNPSTCPLLI